MLQRLMNMEAYEKVVILCCGSFSMLILILLLSDAQNPDLVKLDFEKAAEKMHKPTRTRVWITIEAFATTSCADSPGDLFVTRDL